MRALALHLLERGAVDPWSFSFRATHYAIAWVAIGALLGHISVKLPVIERALTSPGRGRLAGPPEHPSGVRGPVPATAAAALIVLAP